MGPKSCNFTKKTNFFLKTKNSEKFSNKKSRKTRKPLQNNGFMGRPSKIREQYPVALIKKRKIMVKFAKNY